MRARKKKITLSEETIKLLVNRYRENTSLRVLAEEHGVTTPTMASYLRPYTTIRSRGRVKGK